MSMSRPIDRRTGTIPALPALLACIVFIASAAQATTAAAQDERGEANTLVRGEEWSRFEGRFVLPDGRVVDRENGGVAHSESQGYGMILAMHAGERRAFDRIWRFTQRNLQVRESDDLLAWQWDPASRPHVADENNATDGDILVAYALLRAAARWSDARYAHEADRIVDDIGRKLIATSGGRTYLRAADYGFDRIPGNGGPVVNPSYYIFAAFPLFEVIRPEYPWRRLMRDGLALLGEAQTGRSGLVPDWVALSGRTVRIADGFDKRSSYDAVRVPLYLLDARQDPAWTTAFDETWNLSGKGHPVDYDLAHERGETPMADPGYRTIAALVACARRGTPIPPALRHFRPTTYFASSLHLIALAVLRRDFPNCLNEPSRDAELYLASRNARDHMPHERLAPSIVAGSSVSPGYRRSVDVEAGTPSRQSGSSEPVRHVELSFSDRIMRKSWLPLR